MKVFVVAMCIIAAVAAAPTNSEGSHAEPGLDLEYRRHLPAVMHKEEHDDYGQFNLEYITAEGIHNSERGRLVPTADGKARVLILEGEVSYIGDDGKTYTLKYTADTDGYKAEANYLPVAPAVPASQ